MGNIKLENLQTALLQGSTSVKTDDIRISIGWRNPQEDAYDVTNIDVLYNENYELIEFLCYDGYANGSISTIDHFTNDGVSSATDLDGFHNITIPEWTNYKKPQDGIVYRIPEINNCELISTSATERQNYGDLRNLKQSFTASYRKPFIGSGL